MKLIAAVETKTRDKVEVPDNGDVSIIWMHPGRRLNRVIDLFSDVDRKGRAELAEAAGASDEGAGTPLYNVNVKALQAAIVALDDEDNRKLVALGAALASIVDPNHIIDPSYKGEDETESNAGIWLQIEDLRTMLREAVLKMEELCVPPECLDSH